MTPDRMASSGPEPDRVPLQDVLDAYLASVKKPSSDALAEWIRRFPDYAQELTEFAATWALMDALLPQSPDVVETASSDRPPRLSRAVRDLLREKSGAPHPQNPTAPPITDLVIEAKMRGMTLSQLADVADMSVTLVRKLDRRLIKFSTIPRQAIEALALALGRDAAAVSVYLQGPPMLPVVASFRANAAPAIGEPEDFFSAVHLDPTMAAARRRRWLALAPRIR